MEMEEAIEVFNMQLGVGGFEIVFERKVVFFNKSYNEEIG